MVDRFGWFDKRLAAGWFLRAKTWGGAKLMSRANLFPRSARRSPNCNRKLQLLTRRPWEKIRTSVARLLSAAQEFFLMRDFGCQHAMGRFRANSRGAAARITRPKIARSGALCCNSKSLKHDKFPPSTYSRSAGPLWRERLIFSLPKSPTPTQARLAPKN